jgi:hypothetical protein
MDSFTIAILIGGAVVLIVLVGMIVIDRGAPPEQPQPPETTRTAKRKSRS